jgi:AcrR family transcriptional regulator
VDGPKFRRRAEARPDEVLDAALALFVQQGFARTTVDQIARRAGISKGALYLYFPSKKAVLESLVRRALMPTADKALAMVARYRGDPRPLIRQLLTVVATGLREHDAFQVPKLVIREAVSAPEIAEMYRREVLDRAIPALTALLAQGIEGGHIRKVDPGLTVRSVMGPIMLHVLLAEIFGIRPAEGYGLDRLIDNHLSILFAGLEPEKAVS